MSSENTGTISESISISQLNDSNYAEWAIRMEAILVRYDLWLMVEIFVESEGKTQQKVNEEFAEKKAAHSRDKMARAQAEIILRVQDNQLVHLMASDPMENWQTL